MQRSFVRTLFVAGVFATGFLAGKLGDKPAVSAAEAATGTRVFEIRTYTTHEGKLEALQARFRNHTTRLFEKHGMINVAYWTPQDSPAAENTLVYVLAYPSREAAKQSWQAFRTDPEWQKVARESEANGKIVSKVESVFLVPTDYSPVK